GSAHTLLDVVRPCDTTVDDCLEAGRGRNLNGQQGVTSILTPRQLNDLVAFQKTPTLATSVGTNERVIGAGALDLSRALLAFGNPKRRARSSRPLGRFDLRGVLRGAPRPIDPAKDGVVFSLATPQGGQMAIVARRLATKGGGRRLVGHSSEGGGVVTIALARTRRGYRFTARGRRLDVAALEPDAGDPKSRDLPVAVVMSRDAWASRFGSHYCNLTQTEACAADGDCPVSEACATGASFDTVGEVHGFLVMDPGMVTGTIDAAGNVVLPSFAETLLTD